MSSDLDVMGSGKIEGMRQRQLAQYASAARRFARELAGGAGATIGGASANLTACDKKTKSMSGASAIGKPGASRSFSAAQEVEMGRPSWPKLG
jgi:hypothetical protein